MKRVFFLLGLVAACGYAGVDGDSVSRNRPRAPSEENEPSETDAGSSVVTGDAAPQDSAAPAKPASTTCTIPDLALCFRFEGNAVDQSPAPIVPKESTNIVFVAGKEDMGGLFNTNTALRFAPNAAFDLTPNNGVTIEAWINREATNADAVVFDDDERFSLTINAAGNVLCKSSGGAVQGTKVVAPNQWAHVACVITNGTMTAYLNGAADQAGPGNVVPTANPAAAAAIGGNSPNGEPFVGVIDSFRLLRVARTPEQIAADAK